MAKRFPETGELKARVVLQTMQSVPSGVTIAESFTTLATVWAKHSPVTGITQLDTKAMNQAITDRFIIRYRTDVVSDMYISYDGKSFRIRTFEDIQGAKRFLELCTERQ